MGVAPRRLWGWEPETRIVPDGDGWVMQREPEFDKEQYELVAALYEHEASLNEFGIPLEEAMSPLADPDNPNATHVYRAKPIRDWYEQAIYDAQQDEKWKGDNFTPARKWVAEKIDLYR